ncbi:MAG: FecR domain-containing protein [Prolixibacteraceae bacterium]|nr:FecR domain-containing protein [Prolixibacteraceae bacterium]
MEKESHIYKLIQSEYRGGLNHGEQEELKSWVQSSEENNSEYRELREILVFTDRLAAMRKVNVPKDLSKVKKRFRNHYALRNVLRAYQKIAAILLIPILVYSLWQLSGFIGDNNQLAIKTAETAFGVRSQIELADGTKVWLNSGTRLTYPDQFKGKTREVKLKGEAYFQVRSDEDHPFYVDLGSYKIKATGTSFNITNYADNHNAFVYLEQGKVQLTGADGKKEIQYKQMDAGELLVLDKQKKAYQVQKTDGIKYLGWTEGKLIFRNDGINEVAMRLGYWFNAEIVIQDQSLNEYIFTATFENETLDEALKLLSYSSPIAYSLVSMQRPDGTGAGKRKVIIFKKE